MTDPQPDLPADLLDQLIDTGNKALNTPQIDAERSSTVTVARPVKEGLDANQRLHDLYGTNWGRGRQVRTGRTVLGWRANTDDLKIFYILKDGTHAGPFDTVDEAETDAKRRAQQ